MQWKFWFVLAIGLTGEFLFGAGFPVIPPLSKANAAEPIESDGDFESRYMVDRRSFYDEVVTLFGICVVFNPFFKQNPQNMVLYKRMSPLDNLINGYLDESKKRSSTFAGDPRRAKRMLQMANMGNSDGFSSYPNYIDRAMRNSEYDLYNYMKREPNFLMYRAMKNF